MSNLFCAPYARPEHLDGRFIVATYAVYGTDMGEALQRSANFAVGQSVGTWLPVPGISREMIDRYQGRVIGLYPAGDAEARQFILRVAFALENVRDSLALLLTALVGNDVSTAMQVKLLDLELGAEALGAYRGPRQGIDQLRALTGAYDRPVVLNMIKPCVGFTPEEGSRLFFEVAKGGVDLIKDDELLGTTGYSDVGRRVALNLKAAEEAAGYSGRRTSYMVNITASPKKMRENALCAIEAGARAAMVNFVFTGPDALAEICEEFGDRLFIMAHYAGVGVMNWARGGIANPVFIGLLPRLAGAHAVMTMVPDRRSPEALLDFHKTVQAQGLPMGPIAPLVTAVGGGVTPANQKLIQEQLGKDFIIGIGGAIQGHPLGTAVGAQAAMAAVSATARGLALEEAAQSCEGLRVALERWP